MPLMIPDIDPNTIENDGERVVYAALKEQLPADWTVRYDLTFCRQRSRRITPDGQVDFIVVIPGMGLLFLEVKGIQNAKFSSDGGQCYWIQQNGSRMLTGDPFTQAQSNKHDAIGFMREDLNMQYFPGRYGHVVLFPFALQNGTLPQSHEPQVVWLHGDMNFLERACRQALVEFGDDRNDQQFGEREERRVCEWLRDRVELVPIKIDTIDNERVIETLTRQQYDAVTGVLDNPRVRIEGVAGSGKTLLVQWAARDAAEQGKRVLVLCFNQHIGSWLSQQMRGTSVTVSHFHSFAKKLCKTAGVRCIGDNNDQEFWTDFLPIQLMDAVDKLGVNAKYDIILVDEAQDFHPNWWVAIEMMLSNEDSNLHIFLDPEQAGVYGQQQTSPCSGITYKLTRNCRNTRLITNASGKILGRVIASKNGMPEGLNPEVMPANCNVDRRSQRISTLVNQLLQEGTPAKDIAILSPWAINNNECSLRNIRQINRIPIRNDVTLWRENGCIWGSTIKSFKGLEAKCVLLTDIPQFRPPAFSKTDLYVAVTRAKHRLFIVPSDPGLEL